MTIGLTASLLLRCLHVSIVIYDYVYSLYTKYLKSKYLERKYSHLTDGIKKPINHLMLISNTTVQKSLIDYLESQGISYLTIINRQNHDGQIEYFANLDEKPNILVDSYPFSSSSSKLSVNVPTKPLHLHFIQCLISHQDTLVEKILEEVVGEFGPVDLILSNQNMLDLTWSLPWSIGFSHIRYIYT